ncbi:hypothetical protein [Wolbachia endosymbiont (group B) of Eucosma cana]|uniref:hypothetical protein n=1 Tax=Wolbachia endosymbiont (group B) of Eucosma cana TaxID=2954012 RepID=UPI00222749EF|nr:hypothetical protein [Wolbachia endosymbiont (group B) of Eucosma cana]
MNLEQLKKLQLELLGIIFLILAPASAEEEKDMKDRALKIIDELKDHINDCIEISNRRMTILDCIVLCDSQGNVRLNNRSLLDLEDAVKSIGGKTSQELGRRSSITQQEIDDEYIAHILQIRTMFEQIMQSRAEFIASMEETQRRRLIEESRESIFLRTLGISKLIISSTRLGESEVGEIIGCTLGGLLSIPAIILLAPLTYVSNTTSREIRQRVVDSISESTAGLSAALGVGTIMLISRIVRSTAETNMVFGESLRSGLMTTTAATIGAGAGAALSTALARRMFAPISTNLENVATEQQNIQGQSI